MENFDRHIDDIQAYLNGLMTDENRARFETLMAEDQTVEQAVKDFKHLKSGLKLYDFANEGHIASEQLAWYTSEPSQLSADEISEIEDHLATCTSCSEEYKLCGSMPSAANTTSSQNLFEALLAWLIKPELGLRPVVAMGLMLVCLLPAMIMYTGESAPATTVAYHNLSPAGQRAAGSTNDIIINHEQKLVDLSFSLPVSPSEFTYMAELASSDGTVILRLSQEPTENSFALQLPVSYLDEGKYTLTIKEIGDDQAESDLGSFVLNIRFIE